MIKLSKKGNYGLKAISFLASKKGILVKISDISKELKISETFLRRIINDFEKADLLKTIKGRNGGVIFEKELKNISLYDIFVSMKEDLSIVNCTSGIFCENQQKCITTVVLNSLQKGFNSLLKIHTLDKIIR
ncbi:MAG: Rrf2 family transcriptional regulator [Candidatus Gracilibacteria bacterium]|nr:Rrf2 family transcriptional regulator [Candidatus Gracilibacteria bacterium]